MRDDFIKLAAPCDPRKFIVITNGYDADNFRAAPTIPEASSAKEVSLAHVGVVVSEAALPLLEALELLYQEDRSSFGKLKVRFVGGLREPDQTYLSERIWSQAVEVITRQAHAAAIDHMLQADLLLLMLSDEEAWRKCYPGKLFEYLRAGKPILAIMPSGIATDLVAEAGVGVSFEPSQVRAIADQLRRFAVDMLGFRDRHFRPRPEIIAQYDGRTLTERLAAAFDQLLSGH
jgi:glycosyltransferase involved in cell wall biosynthesis